MTLNLPPGIPGAGALALVFVPGGLTTPAAPKLTEISATTSINISCHLMSDGFGQTAEQNNGTGRRLCSSIQYDVLGPTKFSFEVLKYVYDPQNPLSTLNKAYAGLIPGTVGDLVMRWGIPGQTDFATTQVVDVKSIRLGPQNKETPTDDGELVVTQPVAWTGAVNLDKAIVA